MVKKIIFVVIFILVGVGGYFICKSVYYNKIYNYGSLITHDMEEYYKSNDTTQLDNIKALLPLYEDKPEIINDINNRVLKIFQEWYDYTNGKYKCQLDSVNECILYYAELTDLEDRLLKLTYSDLILTEKSKLLITQIDEKLKETKDIIDDKNATHGVTYEDHRKELCDKVTDCKLERDGTSTCTYTIGSIKETVICKKQNTNSNTAR